MTLMYRSVLKLSDEAASADTARYVFGSWLIEKNQGYHPLPDDLEIPEDDGESRIAGDAITLRTASDDAGEAARIALTQDDGTSIWRTALTIWQDDGDRYAMIEVDHASRQPLDRPPNRTVPNLVDHVLRLDGVTLDRAPVSDRPWAAETDGDVEALCTWILNPARTVPVHVVGHGGVHRQALAREVEQRLHRSTRGQAVAVRLANQRAQDRFIERLGRDLAVWDAAVRTYLPIPHDATPSPKRHRYVPARRLDEWRSAPWMWSRWADRYARSANSRELPEGQAERLAELFTAERTVAATEVAEAVRASEEYAYELIAERDDLASELERMKAEARENLDLIDSLRAKVDGLERRVEWLAATSDKVLNTAGDPALSPTDNRDFGERVDDLVTQDWPGLVLLPEAYNLEELQAYAERDNWLRRTEEVLQVLCDYVQAKDRGFDNGLRVYLDQRASCSVTFADNEGRMTKQLPAAKQARTFRVPEAAAPEEAPVGDGEVEVIMWDHFKIGGGGPPAPRLHLYDATRTDGKVYVGHIGPHLVTAGTSRL